MKMIPQLGDSPDSFARLQSKAQSGSAKATDILRSALLFCAELVVGHEKAEELSVDELKALLTAEYLRVSKSSDSNAISLAFRWAWESNFKASEVVSAVCALCELASSRDPQEVVAVVARPLVEEADDLLACGFTIGEDVAALGIARDDLEAGLLGQDEQVVRGALESYDRVVRG